MVISARGGYKPIGARGGYKPIGARGGYKPIGARGRQCKAVRRPQPHNTNLKTGRREREK